MCESFLMFPPPPARSQYSVLIMVSISVRARFTELVEPVLVLSPFLASRVDLPRLAGAASSSKQASNSTREIGKNQKCVVVLHIRVKFWWMITMGVKYNHTKFEQVTQRWRRGTGFARGGPQFQKLQFRAKNSHFCGVGTLRIAF